jgi:uncharacterized protein DUF6899
MPYIAAESRPQYEELIRSLAGTIREATGDHKKRAGHLNYVVTRLLLETYGRKLAYWQHNEIVGMLECCKQEFYRRRTGPYEDTCIEKNGDV